jgi:hypothetical protein
MSAWVRFSRQRFIYTGRISRAPFARWVQTDQGRAAVDEVAETVRFSIFGRQWAARRRLWRALKMAARDEAVIAVIRAEAQSYLKHLGDLAYADGLPRNTVMLRRLVAVPTVLLNGNAYGAIETSLASHHAFTGIEGGDALRQFFVLKLVEDLEAGAGRACPSLKTPLPAGRGWVIVGRNLTFDWRLPLFNEPLWAGHHYVLELTREPITRAVRKAVETSMSAMEKALPTLPRLERNDILRRARPVGQEP